MADARPEPDLAANPGQARQLAWPGLGQAWHSPAVLIGEVYSIFHDIIQTSSFITIGL